MRWLRRGMFLGGFVSVLTVFAPHAGARQDLSVPAPNSAAGLVQLAGVWDYNPDESVDAATGRPEQAPKSATQRGAARGSGGRVGNAGGRGGGPIGGGLPGDSGRATGVDPARARPTGIELPGVGPTPDMIQAGRDLNRDLLEIPEALTINVDPTGVTFTDDLERTWTYHVGAEKQKYQVGAAKFEAALAWSSGQLLKKIDGPYGFRMTETYFLSPDGKRLFVILRVGTPKKGQPVVGANRVYDRVE